MKIEIILFGEKALLHAHSPLYIFWSETVFFSIKSLETVRIKTFSLLASFVESLFLQTSYSPEQKKVFFRGKK